MRVKRYIALIVLLWPLALAPSVFADTYSTFQTTRYYSANRCYLVVVTQKKHATLYRNDRGLRRVWSRTLLELPQKLFVTNDGKRVAIVDRYYGNGGSPETPVVIILGENGEKIASHSLGEVANLKRVMQTISAAHWYSEARLAPDGKYSRSKPLLRSGIGMSVCGLCLLKRGRNVGRRFPISNSGFPCLPAS